MNKLQKAIAERARMRKRKLEADTATLTENDTFMELQAKMLNMSEEVKKLDTMINQLNTAVQPFVSKTGDKYSVRVFPISQFGLGLDKLVGVVAGSMTAFTDEMADQYEAIVGVPFIELQLAAELLGTVDYVNRDGQYVEGSRTVEKQAAKEELGDDAAPIDRIRAVHEWERKNIEELHAVLTAIAVKLGLYEIVPDKTELLERVRKWEAAAKRKAERQLVEIEKAMTLADAEQFTIDND